jgi:tetratricopeptide (TPR) repeat protein
MKNKWSMINGQWLMVIVLSFIIYHVSFSRVVAQSISGSAPSQVAVGEQFRLTYTINSDDVEGFRAGNIPNELEVLMGPSTSRQSSFQMINGRTSSSSSITYTYILSATDNGTFTIPPARATVNGKQISSNSIRIKVSGQAQGHAGSQRQQRQSSSGIRSAGTPISGSDLFIKVSANKNRVHEQEPILLTYKVYTLVDLTSLNGKMPDLKSFYSQEIALPQQKKFTIENVNGKPYRTVTWSQYVMFPQMTGKLEIPPITFEGVVVQANPDIDPFEAFFNGGSSYVEVKKQIKAPGLSVEVLPLPERPANFSGGVGQFNIKASLDQTEVKANDPVTLRITVSGAGNMKLLKEPVVNFPQDFDKYDAKQNEKTKLTANGLEGSITYEFLAVPRHQGTYDIPPVEFVYYDTRENAYKTLKTEALKLNVAKGNGSSQNSSYNSQQDVEQLNKDIHYIKTGDTEQRQQGDYFFGSTGYWVALLLISLLLISLIVIFRQRAIDNANIGKMRGKKANKVAVKRLKLADKLMKQGKANEFYDEVLRALWGYVGDKLNIPVEQLSRDNISQQLSGRNVDEATIAQFIGALDECEFERYAPGDAKGNMNKTFDAAMTAIIKIEDVMKKKHTKSAKTVAVLLVLMLLPMSGHAVTKAEADSAYARQHYQDAIKQYEALLQEGVSADLYYNLGNAYYRSENFTRAIINYERALLLEPGDKDIRHNLQLARQKTTDKLSPSADFFLVTWYRSLVNIMGVDSWAWMALVALAMGVVLFLVYLFSSRVSLQKVGFFGAAFMLLFFLIANLFAWHQSQVLTHRTGAVVIASETAVKSTPAQNGTNLFMLHEGTKVEITDDSMKDWKEVRLPDGKEGWISTSSIEVI